MNERQITNAFQDLAQHVRNLHEQALNAPDHLTTHNLIDALSLVVIELIKLTMYCDDINIDMRVLALCRLAAYCETHHHDA